MRTLAANPELVERMGAEGRIHAARFTWDSAARRLLDAFDRRLRWRRLQRELAHAPA
jgi:glycosyltransferase involved in cell wall biosynthesis